MIRQKLNRLERSRNDQYNSYHQKTPNMGKKSGKLTLSINFDSHTYTKTNVMKPFHPHNSRIPSNEFENNYYFGDDKKISYWGKGVAGVEPIDFSRTLSILRENTALSPYDINLAPIGRINDCWTPYQNDQMTYHVLEAARNELQHRAEHLAWEMKRVDDLWNTEPAANSILRSQSLNQSNTRSSSVQREQSHKSDRRRSKRSTRSFF